MRFSESTQYPVLIILFWFLLSTWNRNTYFQVIYQCVVVSEWKRQVVIEQARFLSTVFLCRKFKLENINSEIKFCTKNVCGNFYLRELLFVDHWKKLHKSQNLEPAKILCHTVVDLLTSRIACTFLPSLWHLMMIFGFASCGFTSTSDNFSWNF